MVVLYAQSVDLSYLISFYIQIIKRSCALTIFFHNSLFENHVLTSYFLIYFLSFHLITTNPTYAHNITLNDAIFTSRIIVEVRKLF